MDHTDDSCCQIDAGFDAGIIGGADTVRVRYYQLVLAIVLSSIVYDGTLILLGTLARLGLGRET